MRNRMLIQPSNDYRIMRPHSHRNSDTNIYNPPPLGRDKIAILAREQSSHIIADTQNWSNPKNPKMARSGEAFPVRCCWPAGRPAGRPRTPIELETTKGDRNETAPHGDSPQKAKHFCHRPRRRNGPPAVNRFGQFTVAISLNFCAVSIVS